MFRLLQGDVGSGKTAVAFLSMLGVAEQGSQSCLLAPTEVLAIQHLQVRRAAWKLPWRCFQTGGGVGSEHMTRKGGKRQGYSRVGIQGPRVKGRRAAAWTRACRISWTVYRDVVGSECGRAMGTATRADRAEHGPVPLSRSGFAVSGRSSEETR